MFGLAQTCGLRLHRPGRQVAENGALTVARCDHCRALIISRDSGLWRTVPRGKRIVWRKPDVDEMAWPTHILS